jgi:hypothetical protein
VHAALSLGKNAAAAPAPVPHPAGYDPAQRRRELSLTLGFDIDGALNPSQQAALQTHVQAQLGHLPANPLKFRT